jgi:hypothetical protein
MMVDENLFSFSIYNGRSKVVDTLGNIEVEAKNEFRLFNNTIAKFSKF